MVSSPSSARRTGPVFEPVGTMQLAPSHCRSSKEGLRREGTRSGNPLQRARMRRSENVPVRCLKVCCRSRRAVPDLRSLLALSAGRCTGSSAHRANSLRVKRRKTGRKTHGIKGVGGQGGCERARNRGARIRVLRRPPHTGNRVGRARKSRTSGAITMVGSWVVALAGTCGRVTKAKALGM